MADSIVLWYEDAVIRNSDLDILRGPCLLSNEIIRFYFKYLASKFRCDDIVLVLPTLSCLLLNVECPGTAELIIEPLRLHEKKIAVFAVNRCFNREVGETVTPHWSVLVYYRVLNLFVHHDSVMYVNHNDASKLYEVVYRFVNADNIPNFLEYDRTPQMDNRHDCGMYVLATVRMIFFWHLRKFRERPGPNWFSAMKKYVTEASVETNMRPHVLRLIEDLRMQLSN